MTSFIPSEDVRKQLIENLVNTLEQRFYDPKLHDISVRDLFGSEQPSLLRTPSFTTEINRLLSKLQAYPTEFAHESERRVGLWKAIKCSFFRWNGAWIFQDVLVDGHAERAGVRPGATLLAIDGVEGDSSDIPRFRPRDNVRIAFQNPGKDSQTFDFNPAEKEDEAQRRYVAHRKVDPRAVKDGVPTANVVTLPGANHYIFLSNEADVLRQIRVFIAGLH